MRNQADTTASAQDGMAAALHSTLVALQASGEDRVDPVRFRYIQALAARSVHADDNVAQVLVAKARRELQAYQSRLATQRTEVAALLQAVAAQHPDMAASLQSLFDKHDFTALRQLARRQQQSRAESAITALTRRLHIAAHDMQGASDNNARELKAARYFRAALQQQQADTLVTRALTEAPEGAGPLNPQKLALRSLAIMRDLSPTCLGHFVAYIDTLFWLEQLDATRSPK